MQQEQAPALQLDADGVGMDLDAELIAEGSSEIESWLPAR
jgi:hypothetical protein